MKESFGYRGLTRRKIDICEYHEKYHADIHMRGLYIHINPLLHPRFTKIFGLSVSFLNENIPKFYDTQMRRKQKKNFNLEQKNCIIIYHYFT